MRRVKYHMTYFWTGAYWGQIVSKLHLYASPASTYFGRYSTLHVARYWPKLYHGLHKNILANTLS